MTRQRPRTCEVAGCSGVATETRDEGRADLCESCAALWDREADT